MPKVYVRWGKEPKIKRLTANEKRLLKAKIDERAKDTNAFLITLTRREYHWLKKNLANAEMEVIMHTGINGGLWVAIGSDVESVAKAKQEVRP